MKLFIFFFLTVFTSSLDLRVPHHSYSMDTSKVIANGIKQVMYLFTYEASVT